MTLVDEFEDLRRTAEQAVSGDGSDWTEWWARVGFVARGIVYVVVGLIAVHIAWSERPGTEASKAGAVRTIADRPFGTGLLVALSAALAGYALWRFAEALWGKRDEVDRHKRNVKRFWSAAKGLVYVGLLLSIVRFVMGDGGSSGTSGGPAAEESWTAVVLGLPGGQVLVGAAAAVLIGFAGWLVYRGLAQKYEERLDTSDMGRVIGRAVDVVGVVGLTARGAVVGLVGYLLAQAALEHDAEDAGGIDEALRLLVDESYGRWIVTVIGAGIVCFGLYSWIEARYRQL